MPGTAEPLDQVVEMAVGHGLHEGQGEVPLVRHRPAQALAEVAAYGQELVEVLEHPLRRHHRHEKPHPESLGRQPGLPRSLFGGRVQRPRSRPMSSFMISFEPAQILVTRASRHARETRYSFM